MERQKIHRYNVVLSIADGHFNESASDSGTFVPTEHLGEDIHEAMRCPYWRSQIRRTPLRWCA
jgi:hypothetical protein